MVLLLAVIAVPISKLLPLSSFPLLLGWWLVLVVSNAVFSRRLDRYGNPEPLMAVQIVIDLVVVSGLLNASGGVENPLYFAYVFPVIVGATLLPGRYTLGVTVLACILFCSLVAGEALHILPHVTLEIFPHSVGAPVHTHRAASPVVDSGHASYDPSFVAGKSLSFVILLLVTSYLTALLRGRLRESEEAVSNAAREAILEHERLEGMVQAAGAGMMVVEPEVTIQWFSRRAGQWLGWTGDVSGHACPMFEVEGGCRECVAHRALEEGRPVEAERRVIDDRSGVVRYFRHAAEPVRHEDGQTLQVVELIEDITQRKALEAEALHAGKLSVLGQLAAGLAHEIGNPIASLTTRLKRLEKQRDPSFVDESLEVLRSQVERIGRTVRNVSLFSRNRPAEWNLCQINDVAREALNLIRLDRRAGKVTFEQQLSEPSPVIRGVRDQIVQVLVNLLLNAVEAMSDGGTVFISSSSASGEVELAVRDTGPGIGPEVRDRVFEPFVTTKTQGVGLGLAISQSLVQAHGGSIEVVSEPEKGTCFKVLLPQGKAEDPRRGISRIA